MKFVLECCPGLAKRNLCTIAGQASQVICGTGTMRKYAQQYYGWVGPENYLHTASLGPRDSFLTHLCVNGSPCTFVHLRACDNGLFGGKAGAMILG